MAKSREHITNNGKAAFYASIWPDLSKAANDCGWALGLHGSLSNDMDIMAMPWTEEAKPVEELMQALSDCFTGSMWKDDHIIPHPGKANNRVVYTMSIWADFHLDINIIKNESLKPNKLSDSGNGICKKCDNVVPVSYLNKNNNCYLCENEDLTDRDIEKMAEEWSNDISSDPTDNYLVKKGFIAGCKAIIELNK